MKLLTDIFSFRSTESLAALGSALICTVFSPTWWLLKSLLNPYFQLDELATGTLSVEALPQFTLRLHEKLHTLDSNVLLGQVLPILLLCVAISFSYLFISGWLGQKAIRLLMNHLRSKLA